MFLAISGLLVSCSADPQQELNEVFETADKIEMIMRYNGRYVSSIKFSYQSTEEIQLLKSEVGGIAENAHYCDDDMGALFFWAGEKKVSEMSFNAAENCKLLCFKKGVKNNCFEINDSLAQIINTRFEMVRSIKSDSDLIR